MGVKPCQANDFGNANQIFEAYKNMKTPLICPDQNVKI